MCKQMEYIISKLSKPITNQYFVLHLKIKIMLRSELKNL